MVPMVKLHIRFVTPLELRMTRTLQTLVLLSVSTMALAACQTIYKLEDAQYWQRKNASSALYLRGPKAQQTLHQDISTCVNEISELERMAPLREALPADTQNGRVPEQNSADAKMRRWDTPKRDGHLYAEHFNYTDFEGCMDYKGWERVEALPYDQATTARDNYMENVYGYQFQTQNINKNDQPANAYNSSPDTKINN